MGTKAKIIHLIYEYIFNPGAIAAGLARLQADVSSLVDVAEGKAAPGAGDQAATGNP